MTVYAQFVLEHVVIVKGTYYIMNNNILVQISMQK